MFRLKGCPRCKRGDMAGTSDIYGSYLECIQCGYILDIPEANRQLVRLLPIPVATTQPSVSRADRIPGSRRRWGEVDWPERSAS